MALTLRQWNAIKDHPNIEWLREKGRKYQAVPANKIEQMIRGALDSGPMTRGCATRDNIDDVSRRVGTFWGNFYTPATVYTGSVHAKAAEEIVAGGLDIAQALRMIFGGTASGRTPRGTSGVNHIHVGGNAQLNILFDTSNNRVLGLVHGHMDDKMSPPIRKEAEEVTSRKGTSVSSDVAIRVVGDLITRA
jgi:hypothetical protein